ncbi:hypothetical protein KP509_23G055300 [Ceratopteris richardii]|uniref:Pectinesterase inhibitor domain-containing protein n=1 Tax=Ceratopteris richardii TaxID=49495 RepID=A0A8T2S2F5_CERRI|nr:hypothetical protein KP509_23G055300 [Ceratopteris richardii]
MKSSSNLPSSGEVVYSKIAVSSFPSSEAAPGKLHALDGNEIVPPHKVRDFCASCGVRIIGCALGALAICLLVILLIRGHGDNIKGKLYSRSPIEAPGTSPSPASEAPSNFSQSNALPLYPLCNSTDEPQVCLEIFSTFPKKQSIAALQDLTSFVSKDALYKLNESYALAVTLSNGGNGSDGEKAALQDCLDLLDSAKDDLTGSITRLSQLIPNNDTVYVTKNVMNVRVLLSSSLTEQDTCWDGFDGVDGDVKDQLLKLGQRVGPPMHIALRFAKKLQDVGLSSLYAVHGHGR